MSVTHHLHIIYNGTPLPIEQLHVTSQVRRSTKMCGKNVWYLYRERRIFNFSVVVERVTAKSLWHGNRLSVGINILEG